MTFMVYYKEFTAIQHFLKKATFSLKMDFSTVLLSNEINLESELFLKQLFLSK